MRKNISVKIKPVLLLAFLLFFITGHLQAQCISGDCANGKGKAKYYDGIYEGEFKDSLPHGNGEYIGKVRIYNGNTDSVNDMGIFYEGFFVKGKRKILAAWGGYPDNENNQRYAKYPKVDGYFMVPEFNAAKEFDYPSDAFKKMKVGKKEIKGYDFVKAYQGINFSWFGKLNKGLMDGEGVFVIFNDYCNMEFEKGKPTGEASGFIGHWAQIDNHSLNRIVFADGKIYQLLFTNGGGDTLTGQFKYNLLNIGDLMYLDGFYTIKYKNGDFYKGNTERGKRHGYGQLAFNNGNAYQGYFYKGYAHGWGTFLKDEILQDSGFYVFNRLIKGTALQDGKYINYPLCISGDCENGFGKANYAIGASAKAGITNIYEGNFVNGIPFGFGEYTYQYDDNKHSKRGTFSAGQLMGEGTITANYGELKKINGNFKNDTLLNGTIDFADGTRYAADKLSPLVFGIHTAKSVTGSGTYFTKKGSAVTGKFYDGYKMNRLFKATYRSADGVVFNFDYNNKDVAYINGVYSYYDIDELDNVAELVIIKKAQAEAEREFQKKQYAYEKEKRAKQAAANADPANWKNDERTERCSVCDGQGHITYTNTFGGGTNTTFVDQKGNYISGGETRTGRTYRNNVTCRACNGQGRVLIQTRKYIGPTF